jgi:uncharacterized protein (PEP-CTERM system associated)
MKNLAGPRQATRLVSLAVVLAVSKMAAAQVQPQSPVVDQTQAPAPSTSQPLSFEPSVTAELIVSDNGNFGVNPGKKSEVAAIITPRLSFRRESPNLRLDGSVGFTSYTYTNNTQKDSVLPRLDVSALATLVRDWLTFEASAQTRDFLLTPLDAESQGGLSTTRFNAIQSRAVPKLAHEFGQSVRFEAVSDNSWTTYAGDSAGRLSDAYVGQHAVSLVQQPLPFGWSIKADRDDTKYDVVTLDRFTTDTARAGVEYLFANELALGVGVGRERNRFPGFSADGDTSLVSIRWRPAATTSVYAEREKRFFGSAWRLNAQHRTPLFALNASASRQLEAFQQQLLALPRGGTVSVLIDEILFGRISDPIQRAQAVQDLINRRALPSQIDQATAVYSERIQLVQAARISAGLLGVRNSFVLAVFRDRASDVPGFDNTLSTVGLVAQETRRTGTSASWNHRVSPTRSIDTEVSAVNSTGAGLFTGKAKQTRFQSVYSLILSPRTVVAFGYRFQRYSVTGDPDVSRENALIATLTARF